MQKRVVAIDLDGTLLAPGGLLSPRNRAAVTSLIESGCHVLIASGRPFEIARELCRDIDFTAPQIAYNGAVIYDPVARQPLAQTCMPEEYVLPVVRYLLDAGVPPIVCGIDSAFVDSRIEDAAAWVPPHLRPGKPLSSLPQARLDRIIKIAGETDSDAIARLRPGATAAFGHDLYVTQTGPQLLEFLHPDVSKGAALERIAEMLDMGRDEILVFGDSHNDLTMFAVSGYCVAMGNATDEVKTAADRIAPRNDEDGVAVVLEELGLLDRGVPPE